MKTDSYQYSTLYSMYIKSFFFFIILLFTSIEFSTAQQNKISVQRYLDSLPNRVYYIHDNSFKSKYSRYYNYAFNVDEVHQPAIRPIKLTQNNSFHVLKEIDKFYYWIPEYSLNIEPLEFVLPDGRNFEFNHNQKPFSSSSSEIKYLDTQLDTFSKDLFRYEEIIREIESYDHNDEMLVLLSSIVIGSFSVLTFTSDRRLFNDISNQALGSISATISVTGIISYIRYRTDIRRLSIQKENLENKYN